MAEFPRTALLFWSPKMKKKLKEKNGKLKRNVGDRLNEMDPFHFFKSKVNGPTRRNDNGFGFFSVFFAVFFLKKRMELERQSHVGRLNENGPTSTKKGKKKKMKERQHENEGGGR